MRKLAAVFAVLVSISGASAAELTLNDLPALLNTLKDCGRPPCEFATLFASIRPDGTITIHYKTERGVSVYGQGATVGAAVRSLAVKLNEAGNDSKEAVRRIAPLLPTQ